MPNALLTGTAMTLSDILSNAGTVVTKVLGWVVEVAETVTSNPMLAVGFYIGLAWLAFNGFRKLVSVS